MGLLGEDEGDAVTIDVDGAARSPGVPLLALLLLLPPLVWSLADNVGRVAGAGVKVANADDCGDTKA